MLDGFHVDVQAAATWYDVDLRSTTGASLRDSADYTSSGSDNSAYGAGVSVTVNF